MMDKDDKYVVIKDVKRINVWIFIASNNQWKIYDVTGKEKDYVVKSPPLYQNPIPTALVFIFTICYIINIESAPANINLRNLTMDVKITQHWGGAVGLVFAIGFAIFMILYRKRTDVGLPKQSQILVRDFTLSRTWILCFWVFFPVIFICGVGMGIVDGNYANLLFYGCVPLYSVLFVKFVSFLDIKRNKYYIVENEDVVDGSA